MGNEICESGDRKGNDSEQDAVAVCQAHQRSFFLLGLGYHCDDLLIQRILTGRKGFQHDAVSHVYRSASQEVPFDLLYGIGLSGKRRLVNKPFFRHHFSVKAEHFSLPHRDLLAYSYIPYLLFFCCAVILP